ALQRRHRGRGEAERPDGDSGGAEGAGAVADQEQQGEARHAEREPGDDRAPQQPPGACDREEPAVLGDHAGGKDAGQATGAGRPAYTRSRNASKSAPAFSPSVAVPSPAGG